MSTNLIYDDPTAGLSLVSTRSQNLELPRYLFFAGNVLDPDRMAQIEHLRGTGGGDEIHTNCFRRSVGGFLRRATLTPMEVWAVPMPAVLIGEGAERDTVTIAGPMDSTNLGFKANRPGALAGVGATLHHVKFYPGDEIGTVLRANEGKGIVEATSLLGQPWYSDEEKKEPGVAQLLNRDFFPTTPPVELRLLREMIDKKAHASDVHRGVARDMQTSCDQFRRWAESRLSAEHVLLRMRNRGDYTYTYSPIARELLRQLEMTPQDSIIEQQAAGISAEQMKEIMGSVGGQAMTPELIAQIVGSVTKTILAAQTESQSVVADPAPEVTEAKGKTSRKEEMGG